MKKYKLINKNTNKEHLCEKVTINGFAYYVNDDEIPYDCYYISTENDYSTEPKERFVLYVKSTGLNGLNPKLLIATNNPNVDIPQVIDNVKELAFSTIENNQLLETTTEKLIAITGFYEGYMQSQETYPFSEQDMIEFGEWLLDVKSFDDFHKGTQTKELLEIWKEQQPKILYYG